MYAGSLLRSASELHRRVDALLSLEAVAWDDRTWRHVDEIRATLLDLATLLADSAPLPVVAESTDDAFATAVVGIHGPGLPLSAATREASNADGSPVDAAGVAEFDGVRVARLERDAARWVAVLSVLHDAVADLSEKADALDGRLRADGLTDDDPLRYVWQSTVDRVAVLRAVLDRLLTHGSFVNRQETDERPERYAAFALELADQ